jgi:hypothetical protein
MNLQACQSNKELTGIYTKDETIKGMGKFEAAIVRKRSSCTCTLGRFILLHRITFPLSHIASVHSGHALTMIYIADLTP